MAKQADGVSLHLGISEGRRWTSPGGHDDADSITLYVGTSAADRNVASRGFEVRIPLEVDDDGALRAGPPEVTEVWR